MEYMNSGVITYQVLRSLLLQFADLFPNIFFSSTAIKDFLYIIESLRRGIKWGSRKCAPLYDCIL